MEYQIRFEDLEKCFKFAIEYHLDKTKVAINRTTGQYRGLGSITNDFMLGKLIELGVANILKTINSKKKYELDFDIHAINKDNVSDPDIVQICENDELRDPQVFIEIKNISPNDRYIGLTAEQFATILKNNIVNKDKSKIFIIYASLISKNEEKDSDLLGVYLNSKMNLDLLKKFCKFENLYVKIQYVLSGEELDTHGVKFNEGSYMYETELFKKAGKLTKKQILSGEKNDIYKKLLISKNKLPVIMRTNYSPPKEFGDFNFNGDVEIFKKENPCSKRMYIHCKSDVIVKNKILGIFQLKKDEIYETFFTTIGRNPTLKRNNIWIAQRNLSNLSLNSDSEKFKEIAEKI